MPHMHNLPNSWAQEHMPAEARVHAITDQRERSRGRPHCSTRLVLHALDWAMPWPLLPLLYQPSTHQQSACIRAP